jgi:acetolactate synthase-1/2/3 large subunit
MVHVNVGTANAVGAIINAARMHTPVIFTAGRTPVTEDGSLPGGRDTHIHWGQEVFDQAGMLREFVKWDYELRQAANLEAVVDRALELAMADPPGPVYLTLPREVLAQRLGELAIESPPRRQVASRRFPDPARIEEAAALLAAAESPLVVTGTVGRNPAAAAALVELADAGAFPVAEVNAGYANFPADHPGHQGYAFAVESPSGIGEADVVLVVESDVPWIPARARPRDDARVIQLGLDPFWSRYPMRSYPCDVPIAADPAAALPLLAAAVRERVRPDVARARRERQAAAQRARRAAWDAAAEAERSRQPIGFQWAARCLREVVDADTIVVNEYPLDLRHCPPPGPRRYFAHPASGGLGWGLGAAVGMKLGAPDKTVIATVGDGAYLFAVPTACHYAARLHAAPILTVVFNDAGWTAVRRATLGVHPDGWAAAARQVPLSDLSPSPRYEEIVRAFDGHGERVEDPAELPAALRRALRAVRDEGRQALVNVICRRYPGATSG